MTSFKYFRCNCNTADHIKVSIDGWFSCLWCRQIWKYKRNHYLLRYVPKEKEKIEEWKKLVS